MSSAIAGSLAGASENQAASLPDVREVPEAR